MRAGLGLIVIITIVAIGISVARRRRSGLADTPAEVGRQRPTRRGAPGSGAAGSPVPVHRSGSAAAVLDRAVARGQITRDTADAILAAERAEVPAVARQPIRGLFGSTVRERRVAGAAVEAVGYLGSVLALVGLGYFIGRSWSLIGQAGRIGLFTGIAALALVVGLLLRDEDEVVIWRLRSVVLMLSTASLAGSAAVIVVDNFHWGAEASTISIGLTVAVYSAVLWAHRDRPAQLATMMIGSTVAGAAAMAWWGGSAATGFTVLGIGIAWLALAWRDVVPPRELATLLGLLATLIGPAITAGRFADAAPAIGLAVAALLLVIGGVTHEFVFTGFAVVGLLAYLTFGVGRWFGDSLKTPGVLLVAGIGLLIATIVLVRRGRGPHGHSPASAAL